MRTLALDGRMGASGDMLLGALIGAGADPVVLETVERALAVEFRVNRTTKNGIEATQVDVLLPEETSNGEHPGDEDTGDDEGQAHERSHDDHHHSHGDGREHGRAPAESHGPDRTYEEVVGIVEEMTLEPGIEADAKAIFELLGEAEASVHGTDLADTHFHEVGADDAIADVVGASLLLSDIDPDRVVTTPLSVGGGEVEMSHGTYPVPAPAVVEIAERADWELRGGPVEAELLTPTGAAILAHYADAVESLPSLRIEDSGYGGGTSDFPEYPNVLRSLVGQSRRGLRREEIAVLETNLDDASPEVLGGLQETLVDDGALDVSIVPTTAKKSRPGHLVKVIAKPEDAERIARRLAEETGTLGVRAGAANHRWVADREIEPVSIDVDGSTYDVDVKVASTDGDVYDVSAEYDDALAVARETDLTIREVMRRAETEFEE